MYNITATRSGNVCLSNRIWASHRKSRHSWGDCLSWCFSNAGAITANRFEIRIKVIKQIPPKLKSAFRVSVFSGLPDQRGRRQRCLYMQVTTKNNFGPFWGCVFNFWEQKSRNLGILCACFEELPNLGGVCFMTFIHISNRWAIITILGHFGGVFCNFWEKNHATSKYYVPVL